MRERADEPDIPARCSAICPSFGDAIANRSFELRGQRQHGAKHFAERRQIVVRNPFAQPKELLIEHRRSIKHTENVFGLHFRRTIMKDGDDSRHALLAEWNQDAPADHGLHPVGDAIGERKVERHREGDVAEFRHGCQDCIVTSGLVAAQVVD